jgi:hypothetical protein
MNNADIPGKYERKIKWLLYNLRDKFNDIIYARVFFTKEGIGNPIYQMNLVLGMPGNNVVIKNTGSELTKLINEVYNSAKRAIAKKINFKKP